MDLTEIPSEIGALENLTILNLGKNKIKELPEEITNLNNLIKLFIEKNELTNLPEPIYMMQNLKTIYAIENKLEKIPISFTKFTKLKNLIVDDGVFVPHEVLVVLKNNHKKNDANLNNLLFYKNRMSTKPRSSFNTNDN
jgi:Leucine-rich repeat (LRR) protein